MRVPRGLWLLLALGCQRAPAPAAFAPPPEATALQRRWAAELRSSDQGDWREAQLLLAREGPGSLRALEEVAAAGAASAERVQTVIELALRWNSTPEELARQPTLWALVAPQLERADRLAAALQHVGGYDVSQTALAELRRLGGLAVPAALALTRSSDPVARAYGVRLLTDVGARVASARLLELEGDAQPFATQGPGWVGGEGTVAALALAALQGFTAPAAHPERAHEAQLGAMVGDSSELIEAIRRRPGASAARTWDEWWGAAREVWRVYWQLTPEGALQPPDREAWLNHWNGLDGFRLERGPAMPGTSVLAVAGPAGATAVITQHGEQVAAGALPLRLEGTPKWSSTVLDVQLPDHRTWHRELSLAPGDDVTLTVLP